MPDTIRQGDRRRDRLPRRPVRRVVAVTGLLASALVGGLGVMLLLATVTSSPTLFLGGGLLASGAGGLAGSWALLPQRRGLAALLTAASVALLAAVLLVPLHDPPPGSADPQVWRLPTGSRLAYLHRAPSPAAPTQRDPIVVLHGGPGIPDLTGDAAYFGQLAALGYHVYVYAQLGAGPSTRLPDPRGYGLGRDVADLEAIRRTLRAPRMILVGHSYGGILAAHYLAAHPERVTALVLSSPGPLDPDDLSGDRATNRLTPGQRLRTYAAVAAPRALLGYALLQINPAAAHAYLGDAEADARNDRVLTAAAPGLHCDTHRSWPAVQGSGFYALQYPQSASARPAPDVRARLAGLTTPTMVVKGGCDYQSWSSATDYRHALSDSQLVYLPRAEHTTYADEPGTVLACLTAFLTDRPLPVRPYPRDTAPPDYQKA